MPRTRWTKPRLFQAAVLYGRGCEAEDIAQEVGSHPAHVREVCRYYGWAFAERPPGNLVVNVPRKLLVELESQARRRGRTPEALASTVIRILAGDPVLLANVLDDDA